MGRTVLSYRQALDNEISRWRSFREALRAGDIEIFDAMMKTCRIYASAGGMATRPILTETMFMSILLGQQKELMEIRKRLDQMEIQFCQT